MQVLKFGGTSVANSANINKVVDIVLRVLEEDKTIVVASAIGGATDMLVEIGKAAEAADKERYEQGLQDLEIRHMTIIDELIPKDFQEDIRTEIVALFKELRGICKGVYRIQELSQRSMDLIMSYGEIISTKIIYTKFLSMGLGCKWVDGREIVKTRHEHSQNVVDMALTKENATNAFIGNRTKLFFVPGFVASDEMGRTTTLGRGGSDYTASLIAASLGARRLEIWTDVSGMMTADPHIVPNAKTIEYISYREALELSHFGAKVVYPPTIQPVVAKGIPILVKNTFDPQGKGTLIESNPPESKSNIKGISSSNSLALLSMEGSGMVGIPGYSSRLFDALSKNEINIVLITQASSVHTMLVVIDEADAVKAKKAVDDLFAYEISLGKLEPLKVEKGFSIISLVGDGMKSQSGASGRMFDALGRKGITIRAIAQGSSERNVSTIISTEDVNEAILAIHDEFFVESQNEINIFIVGYGNVSKELVKIIFENGTDINICGICNTRAKLFCKTGLRADQIEHTLSDRSGEKLNVSDFVDEAQAMNLPHSVFVDCTSDRRVAILYPDVLQSGMNVVACNKIANSLDMSLYRRIRKSAHEGKTVFYYDTNVGAALPVIRTLKQMIASGDKIEHIDAIVSGTLNYIFSEYCAPGCTLKFSEVVRKAKELGYSEPNPRTDLEGTDVLRKAIILARETSIELEPDDVKMSGFLPEECLKGDVDEFFAALDRNEQYFSDLRAEAAKQGAKLRYMAEIEGNEVKIGLARITIDHPFYNYEGTDSAVSISTRFYPFPVVIKGAGAGARITAGGVYGNICLCRNY